MLAKAIISLTPVLLAACAIPGSAIGHYRLEGQLIDKESRKGIAGRGVKVNFPGAQGLSVTEGAMPELFGENDIASLVETDANGRFERDFDHVFHSSFFILPPLGWRPKRPPQPTYIVEVEKPCWRAWRISYDDSGPHVLVWDNKAGEFAKEGSLAQSDIAAESDAAACKASDVPECKKEVRSKLEILWSDQSSCLRQPTERPHPALIYEIPRNFVYASFGDLFSSSYGAGYSRRFFRSGFLRLDVPIGFNQGSYGFGIMPKIRFLAISHLGAQFGVGPEWMHVRASDNLNSVYSSDKNGVFAFFDAGIEYSLQRGFCAEAGYAATTVDQDTHDNRFYARVGWSF